MGPVVLSVLAVLNVPLFLYIRRWLFADWRAFFEAIFFLVKPDLWSWIDGTFWDDIVAECKLAAYVCICFGIVFVEFLLLSPLIFKFFPV